MDALSGPRAGGVPGWGIQQPCSGFHSLGGHDPMDGEIVLWSFL